MQGTKLEKLAKVNLPNLSAEEQEKIEEFRKELSDYTDFLEKQSALQKNFLNALFRRGQVCMGKPKPRKKPGRHQRLKANARLRSQYLRERDCG